MSANNEGDPGSIPGWGNLLEKEMATHSSIPAWKIPWMEESGRLQSMDGPAKSRAQLSNFTHSLPEDSKSPMKENEVNANRWKDIVCS